MSDVKMKVKRKVYYTNIFKRMVFKLKVVKEDDVFNAYDDYRLWVKILALPIIVIMGASKQDIKEFMAFNKDHCYTFRG